MLYIFMLLLAVICIISVINVGACARNRRNVSGHAHLRIVRMLKNPLRSTQFKIAILLCYNLVLQGLLLYDYYRV